MPKLWIVFSKKLKDLYLPDNSESVTIKDEIKQLFKIDSHILIRLRNSSGAIIPIDKYLISNTKKQPYLLQTINICTNHSSCNHKTSSKNDSDNSTINSILRNYGDHLDKIESNLNEMNNEKINNHLDEMEKKLAFIESRLTEVNSYKWNGSFKKQPLW